MGKKVVRTAPVKNVHPEGRNRIGIKWPHEGAVVDEASLTGGQWRELNWDHCIVVEDYDPDMCERHAKAIYDFDVSHARPSDWPPLIAKHEPDFKQTIARRIAQQFQAVAISAEMECARITQRIEGLRANLPNESDALERTQQEIEFLKGMHRRLAKISTQAQNLPAGATEEQVAPVVSDVEDLAQQLKTWGTEYLTKKRANVTSDVMLFGSLAMFLIWCGIPAWQVGPLLFAKFKGVKAMKKILPMLKKD